RPEYAGRSAPGPEDVHRGRAALAARLRRDEATRRSDSRKCEDDPADRSHRASRRSVRSDQSAGEGTRLAREAGRSLQNPRTDEEAVSRTGVGAVALRSDVSRRTAPSLVCTK